MATANRAASDKDTATVTPIKPAKTGVTASGLKFKKTKVVTVPVLKLMPGAPVYIKVEQKMEVSKQIETKKVGDKPMEPATIMHCTDLTTDNECLLIVGKMLASVINESYPADSYVGKLFEIESKGKLGDKKYNVYSLTEIEVETD